VARWARLPTARFPGGRIRCGLRGGSVISGVGTLHAAVRSYDGPPDEGFNVGFRVSEVPEPATLALLAVGGLVALRRRR